MVNVTKKNFLERSQDLINRLPSAAYAAIDLEMTGIALPGQGRPPKDDTPSERYQRLKAVPEKYSIIQAGVALFHENPDYARYVAHLNQEPMSNDIGDEPPEFIVRKYNFYLFAPPSHNDAHTREVVLNPGTIQFLNTHNMDWNKWTREGVPYVPVQRARYLTDKFKERHDKMEAEAEAEAAGGDGSASPRKNDGNRVRLNRPEDVAFVARTMASLREWIDSAIRRPTANAQRGNNNNNDNQEEDEVAARERREREEGKSFLLPSCNAFLRRALYESIGEEYPTLILEKADGNRIRALRLSNEEKKEREECRKQEEWNRLHRDQIGFTDVFRALSAACRGELVKGSDGQATIEATTEGFSRFSPEADSLRLFGQKTEKDAFEEDSKPKASEDKIDGRKIPIIVHNGLMDLLFLLTHCHSSRLPETYEDAKSLICEYFPSIYDTKILSSECSDADIRMGNTALGDLFKKVVRGEDFDLLDGDAPHQMYIVAGENEADLDDPEQMQEQMHEAAYDAFMTGAVFQSLSRRIVRTNAYKINEADIVNTRDGRGSLTFLSGGCNDDSDDAASSLAKKFFGRNKIYLMQTIYTIDLENPTGDDLNKGMLPEATFIVSGIEQSIKTRDIQVGISRAMDRIFSDRSAVDRLSVERPAFEVVWVDDTTFMIATRAPNDGAGVFLLEPEDLVNIVREDGNIVGRAVRGHFSSQNVISLKDYLAKRKETNLAAAGRNVAHEEALAVAGSGSNGLIRDTLDMFYALVNSVLGKRGRAEVDAEDEATSGGAAKRRRIA